TVVVFNNGKQPATYTLQVEGGILVDDAGQTFTAVEVGAPHVEQPRSAPLQMVRDAGFHETTLAKYEGVVKRFGIEKPVKVVSLLEKLMPEPVHGRRMSGALANWQDRHFLNLA